MLGVIIAAYRDFSSRVELLTNDDYSKADRVREIVRNRIGKFSKAEIIELCPDISEVTIERTLNDLKNDGLIIKVNSGRYTKYIWNHEKE